MTRRDPNAPNPYHLLAKLRDEEMAERARLAARGMAVMARCTRRRHTSSLRAMRSADARHAASARVTHG